MTLQNKNTNYHHHLVSEKAGLCFIFSPWLWL